MRLIKILTILSLIAVILTSGCARGEGKQVSGIFTDGQTGGDAETLNWILAADASSFGYVGQTIDSLATYDNQFNIQLRCLAKDIEVSADGLVYTITIRDDLKWSNGSKVTSEDYVYTLKNLMSSDWLNYNYKNDWQEEVDGKTVFVTPQVINDTTFSITRQRVEPEFIYQIYNLTPYPKYIATKYEGNIDAFTQAPEFNNLSYTGNLGPYKYEEWARDDKFVVARNPEYYLGKDNGAPYFEKYITKLFGISATMQAALEAGDITYCGIEPQNVNKFKNMGRTTVYTVPTRGYNFLGYNQRANGWDGLKNTQVRQAISMAIDKQTITQSIYLGFAEPAFSFIPSSSPWYDEDSVVKYGVKPLNDKQKAIALIKSTGYEQKEVNGRLKFIDKNGTPLKLKLVTTPGSDIVESISLLIKQELSEIGIDIELKSVPWPTLLRQYMMNKVPGSNQEPRYNNGPEAISDEAWDLILMAFNTDPLSPSGSQIFFTSKGGLNLFGFFNDKVDVLFKRAKSKEALDKENRRKIYAELSHVLSEEQPADFLVFGRGNLGFQKNVKGIDPGINMGYNYYLWHFE